MTSSVNLKFSPNTRAAWTTGFAVDKFCWQALLFYENQRHYKKE